MHSSGMHSCPFLWTIPVSIPEWLNSTGINCPRNANLAGPSAKFYFTDSSGFRRNDRIPAGITGASQRPRDIWPGYRCKETTASGRSLCTYEAGEACQRKSGIGMDTAEDGYRRGWSGWGWSDVYLSIFSLYYCSPSFNLFVWTHTSFHESSVFVILVTVSVCFFFCGN